MVGSLIGLLLLKPHCRLNSSTKNARILAASGCAWAKVPIDDLDKMYLHRDRVCLVLNKSVNES